MRRFDFPLQRTMDWRQSQCESQKAELQRLEGERRALVESRASVDDALRELGNQHGSANGCTAEELQREALFTGSLFNLDRRLSDEERRCGSEIEAQVERCVQADRAHRLLEKLRDAGQRRWTAEFHRELEEIASESWRVSARATSQAGGD